MNSRGIPTEQEFYNTLVADDQPPPQWAAGRSPYLYRACLPLFNIYNELSGPTLDVASANGTLFRAIKEYFPAMLPYLVTEIKDQKLVIDGEDIPSVRFECEREPLPFADMTFGMIFFCDVIEHLLFDPVWTLLEFNRVLKPGGHLLISTPNAAGIERALLILQGYNPISESQYKPTAVYQRHNREWTPREVCGVLTQLGFSQVQYTTYSNKLDETYIRILEVMRECKCTTLPDSDFGPEIVAFGKKTEHLTLDSCVDPERRWPTWLYSEFDNYRRRPLVFPNLIGDDYA